MFPEQPLKFPSLFCCTQEVQEPIKTLGYKPLQYVSFSDVFGLGALLSVRGGQAIGWEIIFKILLSLGSSFSDKGLLFGGHYDKCYESSTMQ